MYDFILHVIIWLLIEIPFISFALHSDKQRILSFIMVGKFVLDAKEKEETHEERECIVVVDGNNYGDDDNDYDDDEITKENDDDGKNEDTRRIPKCFNERNCQF